MNILNATATTLNIANADYLARASKAAYGSDPASIAEALGLSSPVKTFQCAEKGIFGFVGITPAAVILAFRGTQDIQGWLTDGTVLQISDPVYPGLVHQGFANGLDSVWNALADCLPSPLGQPLWITGHSLGGALATLAAARLSALKVPVQGVYTFGSPRVGNLEFYKHYLPATYRFVNNNDIVPHVPLELLLVGLKTFTYKHVGTLEYLDRQGHLGGGMNDWDLKKEFILNALRLSGHPEPQMIEDHFIDNYLGAIATNLSSSG